MAIADPCFLLDLPRGPKSRIGRRARALLRDLRSSEGPLLTTRFNMAELLVGVVRAQDPIVERAKVDVLLLPFTILEFDARCAEVFGPIVGTLQEQGTPIGDMDALIGAVALQAGHPLITRNADHFQCIPGLEVVTY
jgi:predicted nucleic acid-binding protein